MDRKLRFYLAILILLLLAWFFRWDYTASKTQKFVVMKWKTDRWTGVKWLEHYLPNSASETPITGIEPDKEDVAAQLDTDKFKQEFSSQLNSPYIGFENTNDYITRYYTMSNNPEITIKGLQSQAINLARYLAKEKLIEETKSKRELYTWIWLTLFMLTIFSFLFRLYKQRE